MKSRLELFVVMPAFNEEASLAPVVTDWFQEVARHTDSFVLLILDDGSTDGTPQIIKALREKYNGRVESCRHDNCGHGQTCLRGYRMACQREAKFVLQIDSDGQCDPRYFAQLWSRRQDCDVIYGHRVRRQDGWIRVLAGLFLKIVVLLRARALCVDPNVPYRLMRTAVLPPALSRIGREFCLANVALATLLRRTTGLRHCSMAIHFRKRYGGEPHVPISQFAGKAIELWQQLKTLHPEPGPSANLSDSRRWK